MSGDKNQNGQRAERKSAEVREFAATGRGKKCPVCASPVATKFRPFCSKRCAEVDLGRWLREDYRIPTEEAPDGVEEPGLENGRDPTHPMD